MEKLYFILKLQLNKQIRFLIWYSDELDGLLTDSINNKILAFRDEKEAIEFAKSKGIKIQQEEPALYNLDNVQELVKGKNQDLDCNTLLSTWNLFTDAVTTLNVEFVGNKKDKITNKIYDKLFYGSNLPAITPNGKEYTPLWTKSELTKMTEVMDEGIRILNNNLKEI